MSKKRHHSKQTGAKTISFRKLWRVVLASTASTFVLIAAGCATPIGVTRVDPRTAQYELTANALNTDKPSSFATRQLLNLDLYGLYQENPKEALAKLYKELAPTGDEDRLFALCELSFLFAEKSGERPYYLAAAAYAWAFLLPGKNGIPPRPMDPRARWTVDIYNRALAQGFESDDGKYVVLKGGQFALPFGELSVTFDEKDLI